MLNIKIIKEFYNHSSDKIYHLYVPPEQVIYFGYILESLEGWTFYTTIDNKNSIMHVEVIKDYINDFLLLFEKLNSNK